MIRTATAAFLLLFAGGAHAQQPVQQPVRTESLLAEPADQNGMAPPARLFEIHDGRLWMDGRPLPSDAIPSGLDLTGVVMQMELVGPVTPILEVDGELLVLERDRLVPYEASSKAGNPVYILGEAAVSPQTAPTDLLEPVVDEAYLRQLSDDQTLYAKVQQERQLEVEILQTARRVRALPSGPERDALSEELRRRIGTLFDLKQETRLAEVERAEAELHALRAVLAEREAMREDVVDHRFHELMGTQPVER